MINLKSFFFVVILTSLHSTSILAQEPESPLEANKKSFALFGTYSLYDMWLPSKIGAHLSYGNKQRTYELAYQYSSLGFDLVLDDIGSVTDSRFHFSTRSFAYDNSFNYQYGISYNTLKANLGKSFVSVDFFEARIVSLFWGVGNRFQVTENIDFGVDWFRVFWPVKTVYLNDDALDNVSNEDDRDDLKKLIGFLEDIPTFTVFHFELGYRF